MWDKMLPAPAPPLVFFVPKATYDDLVTSREESHNTTPTGKTGKNTATMVAEPPSSPATWSRWINAIERAGDPSMVSGEVADKKLT
jgi:hypothetical protein